MNINSTFSYFDGNEEKNANKLAQNYEPALRFVFDKKNELGKCKDKIKTFWNFMNKNLKACMSEANSFEGLKYVKEPSEESIKSPSTLEILKQMIDLNLDEWALSIEPNYRVHPQTCVCRKECCDCFDYSPFLHNMKLHEMLGQMTEIYNSLGRPSSSKEKTKKCIDTIDKPCNDFSNEFTLKLGMKDENEDQIRTIRQKIINRKLNTPKVGSKSEFDLHQKSRSVPLSRPNLLEEDTQKTLGDLIREEKVYETKFNSVHTRIREINPNLYKTLVRMEVVECIENDPFEMQCARRKPRPIGIGKRPPWRI